MFWVAAEHGHHSGVQGYKQIFYSGVIVSQRYHAVGISSVGNKSGEAFVAESQYINDFLFCLDHSRGFYVFSKHREREI